MKGHGVIDVTAVTAAALLVRDRFFSQSLSSEPIGDVIHNTEVEVGQLKPGVVQNVTATTPVGEFRAAYLVYQWQGIDVPTLLFHHGSGENPFDFGRFSSNTFGTLFENADAFDINLIAVRAPFHEESNRGYIHSMGKLENFIGMLATSTALTQALADRLREDSCPAVFTAGISLGGFVVNLHRAYHGHLDGYIPLLAGARLDELFLSSVYRKLTAESARANPAALKAALDFEAAFTAVDTDDCRPLLARYDRIVEFDTQHQSYNQLDTTVLEKGHVTGALATDALRAHIRQSLTELDGFDRLQNGTPGSRTDADEDGNN